MMADQPTNKSGTEFAAERDGRLSWVLQPWAVFAPQPFMALGILGVLLTERAHIHYPLFALGLTLGVILSGPPALVWLRLVDRINAKYLQQPYREVISGSTWEQNAVSGAAFLSTLAFGLLNLLFNRRYGIPVADLALYLGGLIGAALAADGVYLYWYRQRKARPGTSHR